MTDELFLVHSPGDGAVALARAAASAQAGGRASFRRGIDLALSADAHASFLAGIGGRASASLSGGIEAGGEIAFRASLPIDLFDYVGVVARAALGLHVTAHVRADLSMSAAELAEALMGELPGPLQGDALDAFLAHTRVSAGGFAEVHAAARAHAELIIAGSLLPSEHSPPGFAATFSYGAALGIGGGYRVVSGIEVGDPDALIGDLTSALTRALVARLDALGSTQAASAMAALMPAASDLALKIGRGLFAGDIVDGDAVGRLVVARLRESVLPFALEAAIGAAADRLESLAADLAPAMAGVPAATVNEAARRVNVARAELDALKALPARPDPLELVPAVLEVLEQLVTALEPLPASAALDSLRDGLVVCAAASALLATVTGEAPFTQIPTRLAALLGDRASDAQRLADLVAQDLSLTDGTLAEPLAWISTLVGVPAGGLLPELLSDLRDGTSPDDWDAATSKRRSDAMLTGLREVAASLIADAQAKLVATGDADDAVLLEVLTQPLLAVLLGVVQHDGAPRRPTDGTELVRMREQLSAAVLQLVARYVTVSVDRLVHRALGAGAPALRSVAEDLRRDDPAVAALMAAVAAASAAATWNVISLDRYTVADVLDFSADLLADVDSGIRPEARRLVEESVALGVAADGWPAVAKIAADDKMTVESPTQLALGLGVDLGELILSRGDDLILLFLKMQWNRVRVVVELVKHAAEVIIQALTDAAATLRELAGAIGSAIDKLAGKAALLLAQLLEGVEELAALARARWDDLINGLADVVVDIVDELPLVGGVASEAARAAIRALGAPLSLLLELIERAAAWAKERILAIGHGLLAGRSVREQLGAWIAEAAHGLLDLVVPLPLGIPDVTIPVGDLVPVLNSALLDSGTFKEKVDTLEQTATEARTAGGGEAALRASAQQNQAEAELIERQRDDARAPGPVTIAIELQGDPHRQAHGDLVTIRVTGAPAGLMQEQILVSAGGEAASPPLSQWTTEADGSRVWRAALVRQAIRPLQFDLEYPQTLPVMIERLVERWRPSDVEVEWWPETWEEVRVPDLRPRESGVGGLVHAPRLHRRSSLRAAEDAGILVSFAAPVEQLIRAGAPPARFAGLDRDDVFIVTKDSLPGATLDLTKATAVLPTLELPAGPSLLTVAYDDGFAAAGAGQTANASVELVFDPDVPGRAPEARTHTTSVTERDRWLTTGPLRSGDEVCRVLTRPAPGLIEHFYTVDPGERDAAAINDGYLLDGVACWVQPRDSAADGATPLFRLFSPAGDHFYTADAAERDNAVQHLGFREETTPCRVFTQPGDGTVPLHRFINDAGDHFYSILPDTDPALTRARYRWEGQACHVYADEQPDAIPLHRLYKAPRVQIWRMRDDRGREYLAATQQDRARARTNFGYRETGEEFYGFADGKTTNDAIPLWRLGNRTHKYTTSTTIRDREVLSGAFDAEGILCHVPSGPIPGSTPLYELTSLRLRLPIP